LTVTLGTWALDYVAATRGGALAEIDRYTPSSALRVFEHGELRAATVLVLLALGVAGLAIAAVWLQEGRAVSRRVGQVALVVVVTAMVTAGFTHLRATWDQSEDRRNSFSRADEAALREIRQPLRVTVYLAAEDPRLADLERGVLAKLERTMSSVEIVYAASSRSGLFERPDAHYGEVWYDLGGNREMSRSVSEPIVLETIYRLAGRAPPSSADERPYPGYPLAARARVAPWVFFIVWPVCIGLMWWLTRRSEAGSRRLQLENVHA
jgi:ABC-2 type transport system permease protein